jgi:hypothetical protein
MDDFVHGPLEYAGGIRMTRLQAARGIAMRIRFTQSGGFAGVVKSCTVDTALLSEADRRAVEDLVADSGLAASGERISSEGRDRRHYAITIDGLPETLELVCDDAGLPAAARPLVAFLAGRARPEAGSEGGVS